MSYVPAHKRQAVLMQKLGITKIEPVEYRKAETDWLVTMADESGYLVTLHRFSTESGVLRHLAKIVKPIHL
jgi:hypothetical protein